MSGKRRSPVDIALFNDGCLPSHVDDSIIVNDVRALEGTWEEMKEYSESTDKILSSLGIGFIKRKALGVAKQRTEVQIKSIDENGNPVVYLKSYYPFNITKDTTVLTDGTYFDQPDPDTCDWKTIAIWNNGTLIQKRKGIKGIMYDTRAILKRHPNNSKVDNSPIMVLIWTLIGHKNEKYSAVLYMKKIA